MLLGEDGQHGSILQLCLARGMAPTLGMTLLLVGPGYLFAETVSNMYKISSGVLTIDLSYLSLSIHSVSQFPFSHKSQDLHVSILWSVKPHFSIFWLVGFPTNYSIYRYVYIYIYIYI